LKKPAAEFTTRLAVKIKGCDLKILSRGRVALLGIAQRQIRVSRAHVPAVCYRRKPLPTSIKTLGDLIQIKRYEKRLTVWQLALKMGIATAMIRAWECNTEHPNGQQRGELANILGFQHTVDLPKQPIPMREGGTP
jgi:ribosome-binding protein aMBF1 (putative translation factor)